MKKLRFVAAVCCLLAGCGGSPAPDVQNVPASIQRMMLGERVVSGDAAQANPAPTDTITIAGYRSNYTIVKDQTTNVVTVTNNITNVVQTYQNPNLIKFVDIYTSFDINGPAGQVYRLYQAAFNRKPDLPGLGFWIAANQNGRALLGVASDFIVSNEFKTMYGDNPTNLTLVNSFYNNVLHRDGEPAGVTWWVGQMAAGATANAVLFGFSDSAENKTNLLPDMQNGFDYASFVPVSEVKTFKSCVADNGLNAMEGQFMLVNNIWNPGTSQYTQCVQATIARETGVQSAVFDWNFVSNVNSVKTFPSIAYGQKSGYATSTTIKLPILVGEMSDVFVQGSETTSCANACLYDTALDLFFSKTKTTNGFNPSSEIMVLTDYNVTTFGGNYQGRVTIDGAEYDLYQGTIPNGSDPTQTWNFISYVAVNQVTTLALNMKSFIGDSVQRGFVKPTEYFDSIEMGTEVIHGQGKTTLSNYQIIQ